MQQRKISANFARFNLPCRAALLKLAVLSRAVMPSSACHCNRRLMARHPLNHRFVGSESRCAWTLSRYTHIQPTDWLAFDALVVASKRHQGLLVDDCSLCGVCAYDGFVLFR